ncbi:MAG TPA: hypothetical protein VG650_02485 [Mycobacteriales bacterium]|nr:hypothetical protein [Mycobacteriales bacterium]
MVAAAAFALVGCSAAHHVALCPGQSSVFAVRVDVASIPAGTALRLCSNERPCVSLHVSTSHHPPFAFVGYRYRGTAGIASVPLSLRAAHGGRTSTSVITLRIPQRQFGACGDYGGLGYATVNPHTYRIEQSRPSP